MKNMIHLGRDEALHAQFDYEVKPGDLVLCPPWSRLMYEKREPWAAEVINVHNHSVEVVAVEDRRITEEFGTHQILGWRKSA